VDGVTLVSGVTAVANSSQIQGTVTNDSAAAGFIGQFITSTVVTPGVTLATTVANNITSIALTAGDWDVSGTADFAFAGTTSYTALQIGLGVVSATFLGQAGGSGVGTDPNVAFATPATVPTALSYTLALPPTRVSLAAASTTVYFLALATFTVAGLTVFGTIRARRMR
jgi:hypothetical protein